MLLVHYVDACGDRAAVRDGQRWYRSALLECERLAVEFGTSTRTVAGIVAALSPRVRWEENLRAARAVLEHRDPRVLRRNLWKAELIRDGESPGDILRGPKVRAFYRAILGDRSAVVLDTWMLRAIGHKRDSCTERQYGRMAAHLAECARIVRVAPSTFQAIIWCHLRNTEG